MTSLSNTPALFLEGPARRRPPVVALAGCMGPVEDGALEAVVDILDEPGGEVLVRVFGSPEAMAALGRAVGEMVALLRAAPVGEDHRQRAAIVARIDAF